MSSEFSNNKLIINANKPFEKDYTEELEQIALSFTSSAAKLSKNKNLLANLSLQNLYDIGYTQGIESILKEKTAFLLMKQNK